MEEEIRKFRQLFSQWIVLKMKLHLQGNNGITYFNPGEIWWASLGQNIGDEQNGKNQNFERPVVILKMFNPKMYLIVPISTKIKAGSYRCMIKIKDRICVANLSQIRTISSRRFMRKMGSITGTDFINLMNLFRRIF